MSKHVTSQMKSAIVLILSFYNLLLTAQEWAPIGAKWYYTAPGNGSCVYIESIKDSVVNDIQCKALEIRFCSNNNLISTEFIHQNGDSIFYLNDSSFYLLYNLSAEINDTVKVHSNEFIPTDGFLHTGYPETIHLFEYQILNYDSLNISGELFKRQQTYNLYEHSFWNISSANYPSVIDRIGSLCYFFGRSANIVPEEAIGQLRCYFDDFINYKNPDWIYECDYLISDISDSKAQNIINYYPNPFHTELRIEILEQGYNTIAIIDLSGKLVYKTSCNYDAVIGHELVKGFYVLRIDTPNEQYNFKIIKY